jgi:hypothetical protein
MAPSTSGVRGGRGLGLRDQQEQQEQEGGLRLHRLGLDQREAEAHGARIGDCAQPRVGPGDKDVRAKHGWLAVAERQFKANLPQFQFPKIPEWGEIMEKHGNELHTAYARQASVKEALDRSNAAVVALLKERGYKVGTHTWKMPWE